jgi:hypothetical protein
MESSRKEGKWKTKIYLEEIHAERSWKKLK